MFEKSSIIFGSLMAIALPLFAEQLTPEQALQRALTERSAPALRLTAPAVRPDMKLTYIGSEAGFNGYYVFSGEKQGFCIVAADDVVDTPILGYSETGSFDGDNMPANVKWFLDGYTSEIKAMSARGRKSGAPAVINTTFDAASRHDVAPICKTKWNQDAPYWDMCPTKDDRHAYTGCVATAVAQIMKAHNWPDTGTGKVSYVAQGFGTQSVDFSQSTYDWDNMLNTYGDDATDQQKQAVAKLMYDIGVASHMMYGLDGSGAVSNDAVAGLVANFKYSKGIRSLMRETFYYDEFVEILYQEMAAGRPVLCGGSNYSGGGHAFVIDGFRTDGYFHLNWGWGGMSDGYFLVNGLDPETQGAGGSTAGYTMSLEAMVGIEPDRDGTSQVNPYLFMNIDFVTPATSYTRTSNVQFMKGVSGFGIYNYTPQQLDVQMGVRLENEATSEVSYVGGQTSTLRFQYGLIRYTVPASNFPTDGNYVVTPAFKYNDKWYDVDVNISCVQSMRLEASNQELKFTPINSTVSPKISNFEVPSEVYLNRPFQVSADLSSTGGEYFATVALILLKGNAMVAVLDMCQVDVLDGDSKHLSWTAYLPDASQQGGVAAGNYKIGIYRYNGSSGTATAIGFTTPAVTVKDAPNLSYRLSSYKFGASQATGASPTNPAVVNANDFKASSVLKVTSGYFADMVFGIFFDKSGNMIGTTSQKFISASANEETTIELTGDYSGILRPETDYLFAFYGTYTGYLGATRYLRTDSSSAIESTSVAVDTRLYPNPVVDVLTVESAERIAKVEIYSLSGTLVAMAAGDGNNAQVDMTSLASGMYIASVKLANGASVNRQIVVR